MSSQLPFSATPPPRSRFTHKNLHSLSSGSPHSPLRVIALIDLDAFYAQCETSRLGLPPSTPLGVQQWAGLIAINYAARAHGITRHMDIHEARKRCPDLVTQHVATWREGDEKWAYHVDDENTANIATHKVSLDPYRRESRKIVGAVMESAPDGTRVEKASVDEVFLDLSVPVHRTLLERYPELAGPPPYDDAGEELVRPRSGVVEWGADAVVDLDGGETEEEDPDWDDIGMAIGGEIVRGIRGVVFERFGYTCSAGVGRNKMLAKLGAGHRKPNQQTVVRNRAVGRFLGEFKITKIRNLGGKLGEQVVEAFGTESVGEILEVGLDRMKRKLGDDTGSWVYQVVRGNDTSEVNSRTQIKSMLSAKSFRPSINSYEQGTRWLRIFVADIFSRLVEEGILENKRRPRTMNLHHRHTGITKSRQAPIPSGRNIDEAGLFELAKTLFRQIIAEGNPWPCANLSLSVGGFEDLESGNHGIGSFLVKGEEARSLMPSSRDKAGEPVHLEKKRKTNHDKGSMAKFLVKAAPSSASASASGDKTVDKLDDRRNSEMGARMASSASQSLPHRSPSKTQSAITEESGLAGSEREEPQQADLFLEKIGDGNRPIFEEAQEGASTFLCHACNRHIPTSETVEHEDWHFARTLQAAENEQDRPGTDGSSALLTAREGKSAIDDRQRKVAAGRGKGKARGGKVDKGQRRLAFTS